MADFADVSRSLRGIGAVVGIALDNATSEQVTVDVGGQQIRVWVARSLAVLRGDLVSIVRHGSFMAAMAVLGPYTHDLNSLPSQDLAPDVRPSSVSGQFVVRPVDTATYRTGVGWRADTTDLLQGDQSGGGRFTGAAFYGPAPTALAGSTVTAAKVKIKRLAGGSYAAAAPTLKQVTESTRPGGAPTLTGSLAGPSLRVTATADVDIGTTWGQALVDGTIGGLAINVAADTPYLRLAGRDTWPGGMVVVLDWRRDD